MDYHTKKARRREFVFVFLLLLILRYVLDLFFQDVAPNYTISLNADFDQKKLLISWLIYIPFAVLVAFITVHKSTLVSALFSMLFILNGIATICLYAYKRTITDVSFSAACLFWAIFALCAALPQLRFDKETKVLSISRRYIDASTQEDSSCEKKNSTLLNVLLFVAFLSAVALSGVYGDFRIFIDFSDVYAYRFEFADARIPSIISYYLRFLSAAILPYLFAAFLANQQKWRAGVALLGGLFTYGIDGLKTTLLIYVIIFFFYIIMGRKNKKSDYTRPVIFLLLSLIVGLYSIYFMFTRYDNRLFAPEIYRVMIIPSVIGDNYFQFIEKGKPLLLSQSILRAFIESPYEKNIYYMVTTQTSNGHASIANTGLFGDAYANFKMLGVIVYPVLYCLVFKVWETLSKKETAFQAVSIGFVIIWNAINLSFSTWLLSGGVIVFCLLTVIKDKLQLRIK